MIKEYTITTNGLSDGNVITQPFKIEVKMIQYHSDSFTLELCTCNSIGKNCVNDDIKDILQFDLPPMSSSKNADLSSTLEVALQAAYPGAWS